MDCFNEEMLKKFVENDLEEVMRKKIQEHIYTCNLCTDKYVNIIEKKQIKIPKSVSQSVLKSIKQNEKKEHREKVKIYAIAATFTLLFYGLGIFNNMLEGSHRAYDKVEKGIRIFNELRINNFMEE